MEDRGVRPGDRASARLRAELAAAGSLMGVPLIVTEDAEWALDGRGLRVGLEWYGERGHGEAEAVALALLQLWESVRWERETPDRARRRRTLARAMPQAVPLLDAVARLQAAAELLIVMPGLREALLAALARGIPMALDELPRHLQWVVLALRSGLSGMGGAERTGRSGPAAEASRCSPASDATVRAEWQELRAAAPERTDPLRRVLAPDPSRTPLRRFERALALLLPPYERLLALDLAARGLGDGDPGDGTDSGAPLDTGHAEGGTETGAATGEDGAEESGQGADSTPDEGASDRARAGEQRDAAEGADLFAAEHAAFVGTILPTPMPAEGALFEATMELAEQRATKRADPSRVEASGAAAGTAIGSEAATALAAYRSRAEALAEPIERMREVWGRVIAERVGLRRSMGRQALPDGDELVPEALATAMADIRAGSPHPRAYRRREPRPRRTRRAGSTDYVVLIDRSASMSGPAAEAAADAALVMLEGLAGVERDIAHAEAAARPPVDLELDIRTSLILFDAEAHVVKPLSGGLDDEVRRSLHAAIRSPRGATNDAAGLDAAAAQLGIGREAEAGTGLERRRIAIVISDGGTNDPVAAAHALRRLRAAGVRVHGVGIANDEIVQRYAPTSRRLDDPRGIAEALHVLVEDELP